MTRQAVRPEQFIVTYVPLPRVWCQFCDKSEQLDSLEGPALIAVQAAHRCGPRTTLWTSAGLLR